MASLVRAAKSGDKKATLIAMRDILAKTIQNCDSGRDMASNTKRLMEVMNEIEQIEKEMAEQQRKEEARLSKHDRLRQKYDNR